ncbi:hypothetical protein C1645_880890 [Glomus cerebriforme]|uniref:Hsp70 protein n=1 Tax=Glomus cerebriforme TaxID=658196 RepID=A0A397SJM5_9GLOM|nr:hypothetical protein C1645_880890 [Glomus cerebriforme]
MLIEENTDKIIEKLGIGFNKLNDKLSYLLEENNNLKQLLIKLEKEKNEEIKLLKNSLIDKEVENLDLMARFKQNNIDKTTITSLNNNNKNNNVQLVKDIKTSPERPRKIRNNRESDIRVVVGLDFGAKYSGFAYCHSTGTDIRINDLWHEKVGQLRTNTVLLYDKEYKNVKLWGIPALNKSRNSKDKLIELFKLHMSNMPDKFKPKLPLPLTYKKAITDYLREFGKVIQVTITKHWPGINFFRNVLLVLTVPAEYPENTKDIMRECLYNAGLLEDKFSTNLQFITESEAAGIHCLKNIPEARDLKPGNTFMIVNCDDVSIDLTIQKLNDKRFGDITARAGEFNNSIDAEFIKYLRKKLGDEPIELLRENNYGQIRYLIQQFHKSVLTHFTGDQNFLYELDIQETIPILKKYIIKESIRKSLEKNEWIIKIDFKIMKSIFEPIIQKIIHLIKDQLYKTHSAIFLIGTFSESKYLQKRVKELFQYEVKIISVPIQPIAAIARGAVIYGLSMKNILR